jgi:hypothetical protein
MKSTVFYHHYCYTAMTESSLCYCFSNTYEGTVAQDIRGLSRYVFVGLTEDLNWFLNFSDEVSAKSQRLGNLDLSIFDKYNELQVEDKCSATRNERIAARICLNLRG